MRNRKNFREGLALQIHDLLDIPLDYHGEPTLGQKIISTILRTMVDALHAGEDVNIPGFGIFRIVYGKPRRTGNNFITPTHRSPVPLDHPGHKIVTFIPAEPLSAMLNMPGSNWGERRSISSWKD